MDTTFFNTWTPRALGLLRIVTGFLYMCHGLSKFFAFPVPFPRPVELMSLMGLAGGLELVGGALVLIGLFTRPVAFLLSGEMAVAYWMAHAFSKGSPAFPITNGGELAVLYCFVFLFLAVAGSGAWGIDAARGRAGTAL